MNSSPGNFNIIAGSVRFASYIEVKHLSMLDATVKVREDVVNESPYASYIAPVVDEAFYNAGTWLVSTKTLYDVFGGFMAGFDVESTWPTVFENLLQRSEISTLSETADINTERERAILPKFQVMMRDINAVGSSSFIIGKTQIGRRRIRMLAAFSAEEKYTKLAMLTDAMQTHLRFHKDIITTYAINLKLYYMMRLISDDNSYRLNTQDVLWPFTVLDFERAALAAMRKETSYSKVLIPRSRSDLSKALLIASYTATGVVIGGGVIGGTIGFVIGVAITLFE